MKYILFLIFKIKIISHSRAPKWLVIIFLSFSLPSGGLFREPRAASREAAMDSASAIE